MKILLLSKFNSTQSFGDKFSYEVKNGKMYFTVNGKKYQFGTKMYPLGKKGQQLFTNALTAKGGFEEVAKSIENSNWKHRNGYCYTNAEVLYEAFKAHGINAKYYSGWVFTAPIEPIHHAWVEVDGNVYDISIHEKAQTRMYEQIQEGKNPYSDACVKEVKSIESNVTPITDNFVWGAVPEFLIYVGAESDPRRARIQYNDCMDLHPVHPSYPNRPKGEKHYRSRYQQLQDKI